MPNAVANKRKSDEKIRFITEVIALDRIHDPSVPHPATIVDYEALFLSPMMEADGNYRAP